MCNDSLRSSGDNRVVIEIKFANTPILDHVVSGTVDYNQLFPPRNTKFSKAVGFPIQGRRML